MSDLPPALIETLRTNELLRGRAWTIAPLAGGITNQNFLVQMEANGGEGETFVLRVAGEGTDKLGIDRQREHACAVAAAACGAASEVIAFLSEHQALLVRYAPGKALVPKQLESEALLTRAVAAMRLFHEGQGVPGEFNVLSTVQQYLEIASAGGAPFPTEIENLMQRLTAAVMRPVGEQLRPCHNDLLPANLIDDGARVWLIDWEYAAMGDPWFDLGNLAENNELSESAERRLLELYFGEPRAEEFLAGELARLRRMRFASAMREAAWGLAQVKLSTLDFDFNEYARKHMQRAKKLSGEGGTL